MCVANGGAGFWIRRTTWGATCARVVGIGKFTKPGPYFGNPPVVMDVYNLNGEIKERLARVPAAGTYKTWRKIDAPALRNYGHCPIRQSKLLFKNSTKGGRSPDLPNVALIRRTRPAGRCNRSLTPAQAALGLCEIRTSIPASGFFSIVSSAVASPISNLARAAEAISSPDRESPYRKNSSGISRSFT